MKQGGQQGDFDAIDRQAQITAYLASCRSRIAGFVEANYAWSHAFALNRLAWGSDIVKAPFNFLMGFPNFLIRLLAVVVGLADGHGWSQHLHRLHLGVTTQVHKDLIEKLMTDLLELPLDSTDDADPLRRQIAAAAREPLRIYVQTRNVAADITTGTLTALVGTFAFHQFTPGSISTGSVLAHLIAEEQAVSEFVFGETLGRAYYSLFPVDPSWPVIISTLLVVMTTLAVVSAFSGFIHDPIQAATGIHQRRLKQMLDAIEDAACGSNQGIYRPRDTFFGRIYDLIDWIKGLLSF